tara:strand:+ start:2884 stop:3180 length:297 start_codon:yes stop_codon:yes gene_type:complete
MKIQGIDLKTPKKVDFFVSVPSKQKGQCVAKKVRQYDFDTSVEQDEETLEWTCYCTKTIVPEASLIFNLESTLNEIAKLYGGYIDGFGFMENNHSHTP